MKKGSVRVKARASIHIGLKVMFVHTVKNRVIGKMNVLKVKAADLEREGRLVPCMKKERAKAVANRRRTRSSVSFTSN